MTTSTRQASGREGGALAAPLDLHEENCDVGAGGCPRWPENMRLLSSHGEIVRGRCGSTNRCSYCARLRAVENAELLALDAMAGVAPECWVVLTTADTGVDMRRFYRSRAQLMRAVKARWPEAEYAAILEYTTGYSARSGGRRFPHWNLMLKGVPAADVEQLRDVVVPLWCRRENAKESAQFVGTIADAGGLMRYLALHFQKEDQAPPPGFKGHRFRCSRGYLQGSTSEAREAARDSLAFKRELWKALKVCGSAEQAEHAAHEAMALRANTTWELVDATKLLTATTRRRDSCDTRRWLRDARRALYGGPVRWRERQTAMAVDGGRVRTRATCALLL